MRIKTIIFKYKRYVSLNTFKLLLVFFSLIFTQLALALESTKLLDVIKANGSGNINLFTPFNSKRILNSVVLEEFRQNNNGKIVFSIDVNEASRGLEKASTQAVTIESAVLIFVINNIEYQYNEYSTRTKALVAKKGSTQRKMYSTLLGSTGSNRITSNTYSDINGSSFDSTLSFPIPQDISEATTAKLIINFLETNSSLGEPEKFYDFSNGYEDIAIITNDDAVYLNDLKSGHEDAPLIFPETSVTVQDGGTIYYPSQTGYYISAFEDYFPLKGDYDFNDLVVGYHVSTTIDMNSDIHTISAEGYLIARGAGYNHDWHLRIAMPPSSSGTATVNLYRPDNSDPAPGYPQTFNIIGDIELNLFPKVRLLWKDSSYEGVNTLEKQSLIKGHRFTFTVALDSSIAQSAFDNAPFDPFIYVHDTGYEIHLNDKKPVLAYSNNALHDLTIFHDSSNYPFAQIFPDNWLVPIERTDLGEAYPDFISFINSGNKQNVKWYTRPNNLKVKALSPSLWKWK